MDDASPPGPMLIFFNARAAESSDPIVWLDVDVVFVAVNLNELSQPLRFGFGGRGTKTINAKASKRHRRLARFPLAARFRFEMLHSLFAVVKFLSMLSLLLLSKLLRNKLLSLPLEFEAVVLVASDCRVDFVLRPADWLLCCILLLVLPLLEL